MGRHLQNFDADRDRSDPKRAAQLFNLLWPSRLQIACANRLANSIHAANDQAQASWEVSMFDWGIRLNVGQVACLDFASDEIVALVLSPQSKPVYSAVPVGSDVLRFPPEEVSTISLRKWDSHKQFIRAAASAKKNSPFADAAARMNCLCESHFRNDIVETSSGGKRRTSEPTGTAEYTGLLCGDRTSATISSEAKSKHATCPTFSLMPQSNMLTSQLA